MEENYTKKDIIENVIFNAVYAFGLGNDGTADKYIKIRNDYIKNGLINDEVKKTYVESLECYLLTEIGAVTRFTDKDVLDIYDEFRNDLGLLNAFPDR